MLSKSLQTAISTYIKKSFFEKMHLLSYQNYNQKNHIVKHDFFNKLFLEQVKNHMISNTVQNFIFKFPPKKFKIMADCGDYYQFTYVSEFELLQHEFTVSEITYQITKQIIGNDSASDRYSFNIQNFSNYFHFIVTFNQYESLKEIQDFILNFNEVTASLLKEVQDFIIKDVDSYFTEDNNKFMQLAQFYIAIYE